MSTKDKLEEVAAAMRARWQASARAEPSQTNPIAGEDVSAEGGRINAGSAVATPVPEAETDREQEQEPTGEIIGRVNQVVPREIQVTIANQQLSPLTGLDLDTAIRLRWALRDIKAKRTKLTPVSPSDLKTLIEMGLVEMRDDAPMLTNEGDHALDQ